MANEKQDELIRAYARLSALRKNISEIKDYHIKETYVKEYHSVLDKVSGIGIDIAEFIILDSFVKPIITSSVTYVGGGSRNTYSTEKYVERLFLLIKLDAVLGYFEIITSEKPKNIGFRTSDE